MTEDEIYHAFSDVAGPFTCCGDDDFVLSAASAEGSADGAEREARELEAELRFDLGLGLDELD